MLKTTLAAVSAGPALGVLLDTLLDDHPDEMKRTPTTSVPPPGGARFEKPNFFKHTKPAACSAFASIRDAVPTVRFEGEQHHGFFDDAYKMGPKLGAGAYATVFKCVSKTSGSEYAVKVVDRGSLESFHERQIREEVTIMRSLKHPNIVQLLETFEDPSRFFLVMELCKGGELFDRIVEKSHYNEREARDVMKILFEALAFAHQAGIVHRDLKPENLLLADKHDDSNIKVADWGIARRLRTKARAAEPRSGTPGYCAPEVIKGEDFGTPVDLWAAGVICFILLGGYNPFDEEDEEQVVNGHFDFNDAHFVGVSEEAKDLIRKLLKVNPKERITAKEALHHPWLMAKGEALEGRDLSSTKTKIKNMQARRRFRAAVQAIRMMNRLHHSSHFTLPGDSPSKSE